MSTELRSQLKWKPPKGKWERVHRPGPGWWPWPGVAAAAQVADWENGPHATYQAERAGVWECPVEISLHFHSESWYCLLTTVRTFPFCKETLQKCLLFANLPAGGLPCSDRMQHVATWRMMNSVILQIKYISDSDNKQDGSKGTHLFVLCCPVSFNPRTGPRSRGWWPLRWTRGMSGFAAWRHRVCDVSVTVLRPHLRTHCS